MEKLPLTRETMKERLDSLARKFGNKVFTALENYDDAHDVYPTYDYEADERLAELKDMTEYEGYLRIPH